jgi:hypothetical protein
MAAPSALRSTPAAAAEDDAAATRQLLRYRCPTASLRGFAVGATSAATIAMPFCSSSPAAAADRQVKEITQFFGIQSCEANTFQFD